MRKYSKRQYAVLGLGIFGSTVAKTLSSYNCEVIALDINEKCVDRMADIVTQSMVCDITDINQLRETGVQDCDIAIVCMGNHLEESVMAIINLKELGVPYVVAKAKNKRYMQIFKELGASKVVRPEKEMGEMLAKSLLGKNIIDLVDLDKEYSIVEVGAPSRWCGKSIRQIDVRAKYGINILAVKNQDGSAINVSPEPDYIIRRGDVLVVIGANDDIRELG